MLRTNYLYKAMSRVRKWITEGGHKGNASIRGVVRRLEAWHTAMVMAEEGVKYRFMPWILQEIMAGLEMTPAEGRTEGGTSEQCTLRCSSSGHSRIAEAEPKQKSRQ